MRSALLAAVALACVIAPATAAEVPIPPSPTHFVTDGAGFLSSGARDSLDAQLAAYQSKTGHQVIVWIGSTTGDTPLEAWTIDAFTHWKVGRKGLDDGAALFIFASDRKVRIEVGYGLEPVLTDARSSEIIRDDIVPKIRSGDRDGAVQSGVDDMIAAIDSGGAEQAPAPEPAADWTPLIGLTIFLFFIALVLWWFRSSGIHTIGSGRGYRGYGGYFGGGGFGGFGGGGGFGGFSGGGGGFGGGGGMGGGGGASGGW